MTADAEKDEQRKYVREHYAHVAEAGSSCCAPAPSCCTPSDRMGYGVDELDGLPEGADMGLGCGNPTAIASLKPGEVVLDLGSGGGVDCFLAARRVGDTGRVIGVDMTPSMISKARRNAGKGGYANVEFRLGEIEHLPVGDGSVDIILSNCVVNLSPEKDLVFQDAYRVLKPGGRLAVSDIVALEPIPEGLRRDMAAVSSCIGGAVSVEEIERALAEAGFTGIEIRVNEASREFIKDWAPGTGAEKYIASATIQAVKPSTI